MTPAVAERALRPLKALLVEDSPEDAELLIAELRRQGFTPLFERVETAASLEQALHRPWDVVLSDHCLPELDGYQAFHIVRRAAPDLPFIMVSGTLGEEAAVDAMRAGAADYFLKGRLARLGSAILRELSQMEERRRHREMEESLKVLQEEFRQAQKMEVVGRLASGVAHDFNNLLTVIAGYSHIAAQRLGPDHPVAGDLAEVKRSVQRAADLTRQLLSFSRRHSAAAVPLNLNAVISEMNKMLRRLIGEDIRFEIAPESDLGWTLADAGQMEQVIMNLVVNARDAMPSGGILTLRTGNISLDASLSGRYREVSPGDYVLLSVQDTGVGMENAVKSRIFEPFFTTKEVGKGTGLGLATVYGIVKQLGGHIFVDSVPGHGTMFHIYLPRCETPATESSDVVAKPVPLSRGNGVILVVEDEDSVRELARRTLSKQGYDVLEASSPEAALQLCESRREPIDLLLSDVIMPGMNGPSLGRKLKDLRPALKILFMSGYTDPGVLQNEIVGRGLPILFKPFRPEDLLTRVGKIIEG